MILVACFCLLLVDRASFLSKTFELGLDALVRLLDGFKRDFLFGLDSVFVLAALFAFNLDASSLFHRFSLNDDSVSSELGLLLQLGSVLSSFRSSIEVDLVEGVEDDVDDDDEDTSFDFVFSLESILVLADEADEDDDLKLLFIAVKSLFFCK